MATYIERETGHFPLSIGTSLAIEGLLGGHPQNPKQPAGHRRINGLWVNVRTLVRNFLASMTAENALKIELQPAIELLIQECRVLQTVESQNAQRRYTTTFYFNTLESLPFDFPHALLKQPKTERQQAFHALENHLLKVLLDTLPTHQIKVVQVRNKPPVVPQVVALLTHYPFELLWRFQFETLFLLESHTGKLKSFSQWQTKLHGVTAEDHIPFNKLTLQLFGDGHTFESFPRKLREEIKQISQSRNWTGVTSVEKMIDDIKHYGGETLKTTCQSLR